jgi:hypothetical protein
VLLLAGLGAALAGCQPEVPKPPDRPEQPVVATVILYVPNMT